MVGRLLCEKDAELLEKFERLASFSEKRRKEPLPPFVLWALDIASRSVESGRTVEHIADNDFRLIEAASHIETLNDPKMPF